MIERTIIKNAMVNTRIKEFLKENYKKAQISFIDIQRTPLNTRVVVYCGNPRAIIGRGGRIIDKLTKILEKEFGLFKPYVDVRAVENPWLDAAVVARRIAEEIEKGKKYRVVAQRFLRRIMEAGAYGVEIRISGKLSGERARSEMFRAGYLKKCGHPARENVDHAQDYVVLKPGKIGIKVSIMVSLPEVSLLEKNIRGESSTTQTSSTYDYEEEDKEGQGEMESSSAEESTEGQEDTSTSPTENESSSDEDKDMRKETSERKSESLDEKKE